MSAHIVERVDVILTVPGDDEVEPSHLIAEPVTGFFEARAVGDEKPPLGEDGAAFQLVHLRGGVP